MRFRTAALLLLAFPVHAETEVRFNRDVRPILSDNCFACHGPDAAEIKGDLQLTSFASATAPLGKKKDRRAITPGNRKESELWWRITSDDADEKMPPPESHHKLTQAQIELLGRWIDEGAKYEGHWAFEPIVAPGKGSIDGFVRQRLDQEGFKPSPQADKRTLLRRLTQDLTGLPPTPEELDAYLADSSNDAYEKQVDRLLASPASAERLALDWLDGARYADTNGYSIDDHRDMWIWRDWVIQAFMTNKPFDAFTIEQLAGDLLPDATEQQKVATGFLRNSMNTHEGGTIAEEYRVTYNADKVDTVSTVFMGLTTKCAQCHDHKYDPITQKEYYQLFAFFNTTDEPGGGATNANTKPLIEASSPLCSTERVKSDVAQRIAELNALRRQPEPKHAAARDAWEAETLPTLAPPDTKPDSKSFSLFPKEPPKWIWAAANKTAPAVEFRRVFKLAKVPETSRLWVTCDDTCKIKINGKEIGETTLWMEPKTFPITVLKEGENTIAITATNSANSPAGLLFSLAMRRADGELGYITSDAKWDARLPGGKWEPPAIVGKHGDTPWKTLYGKSTNNNEAKRKLYSALSKPRAERALDDWKTINHAFAAKSGGFKIYQHQLNLEEKVLRKTANTGRATVMVMNYKPRKTHILVRGAYNQHGDEVKADTPAILPPLEAERGDDAPRTRLDLARWLVHSDHPLTARVIVNRYWQMLFGTGLVKTAEDFGAQGEYPSHPELLDWLAADFVKNRWNLRRLLKQIVMSATYRQSSAVTPELLEKDPYNRLLARAPRYRLQAEFVRDSALAAGGLLNRDIGGPSVHPYQPTSLWEEVSHYGYPSGFTSQKYLEGRGRAQVRRSMYTVWKRTQPPPSMVIFDAPNRETCTIRRLKTNTPLQALVAQNDPQFLNAARALGKLMSEAGSTEAGIKTGFVRVLARPPDNAELALLRTSLSRYHETYASRQSDAKALVDDTAADAVLAAWTLVASTLLNMDEAMTRQ